MARLLTIVVVAAGFLFAGWSVGARQDPAEPEMPAGNQDDSIPQFTAESLTEKASYLIGYNLIQDLKANAVDINKEQLLKGIEDATGGIQPPMSDEEIVAVQQAFERAIVRKQQEMMARVADDNQRTGLEFMRSNALNDGVKELENGVQYSVIIEGDGTESPRLTDRVRVHYKGMFIDGNVFENTSGGPPAAFNVGGVIRGLSSALQQMKVGDKWTVYIPGDLAYGAQGSPPVIGPNQTLIYELELVEIIR